MTVICNNNIGAFSFLILPFKPDERISEDNFVASSEGETIGSNKILCYDRK